MCGIAKPFTAVGLCPKSYNTVCIFQTHQVSFPVCASLLTFWQEQLCSALQHHDPKSCTCQRVDCCTMTKRALPCCPWLHLVIVALGSHHMAAATVSCVHQHSDTRCEAHSRGICYRQLRSRHATFVLRLAQFVILVFTVGLWNRASPFLWPLRTAIKLVLVKHLCRKDECVAKYDGDSIQNPPHLDSAESFCMFDLAVRYLWKLISKEPFLEL